MLKDLLLLQSHLSGKTAILSLIRLKSIFPKKTVIYTIFHPGEKIIIIWYNFIHKTKNVVLSRL